MGHRATYAILENGRLELFYSHWGALSVPQDVFWGPEAAEAFIRENQSSDGWLDDVWGEGGVGLNKDEKTLTWFGGEALAHGPQHELFQELLSAWWAHHGWTAHAVDAMPDVAESVGADRSVATAEPVDPWPVEPSQLGEQWNDPQSKSYFGLLTLLDDREPVVRVLDCGVSPFLAAGADVLDYVDRLPTVDDVLDYHRSRRLEDWENEAGRRAPVTNYVSSGVVIDTREETVSFFGQRVTDHDVDYFRGMWPGWTIVRRDEGGLGAYFEVAGVDPIEQFLEEPWWGGEASADEDSPDPGEDELLAEIARVLLGERRDPVEFMNRVTESLHAEGDGDVWVNPDAMVSPPESKPDDDLTQIFTEAVAVWMQTRRLDSP